MRVACLFLALLSASAAAQSGGPKPVDVTADAVEAAASMDLAPATVAPGLSDAARVSLLTMLPGREIYSLWGHSAFRIVDPAAGLDRTYNYGTFDFEQPFFFARFARGQLDYVLDTDAYTDEVAKYEFLGRPMIEQTLALDPPAVRALYAALELNALPENREYRYDFVFDNCSTRLVDILDTALVAAGQPAVRLAPLAAPRTFRDRLVAPLVGTPLVELGIQLGLGQRTDRLPTPREATFLPLDLADAFDRATVGGRPLVASRDTVFWILGAGLPERAFRWPLAIAWGVLALALGLTLARHSRLGAPERVFDAVLFGVAGLTGVVLFLMWTVTEHRVTKPNWNLAWAWPTHLAAAVALARRSPAGPWRARYLWATAAVSLVVAACVAAGALPQPLPAEVVPVALALAVRSAARARGARS